MSIDTINYLLSKYYESLTSLQYLYQEELEKPSSHPADSIKPIIKYRIEIDFLKDLINNLEQLKNELERFSV